jgi:hypothetical protein
MSRSPMPPFRRETEVADESATSRRVRKAGDRSHLVRVRPCTPTSNALETGKTAYGCILGRPATVKCLAKLGTSKLVLRLTRRRAPKRRHLCRHPTKQPRGHSVCLSRCFATRHQQAGVTCPKANPRALHKRRSHMVALQRPKTSTEHHRSRKQPRGGRPPRSTSTSYGTRTPADDRRRPKTDTCHLQQGKPTTSSRSPCDAVHRKRRSTHMPSELFPLEPAATPCDARAPSPFPRSDRPGEPVWRRERRPRGFLRSSVRHHPSGEPGRRPLLS